MNVIPLKRVRIKGRIYLVDERMEIFRNVENPDDFIPFDEAFVRVRFTTEHVVLNDPDCIRKAKDELRHLIQDAHAGQEIEDHLDTEPAEPDFIRPIIPELLKELEDQNE